MSRQIYTLNSGDKKMVSRNSQWRTVGIKDIFEFANARNVKLYDWSSLLLNWNSFDIDIKKEIYDRECCHELNVFIRFKDEEFFNNVVRKYIKNKINKTFVDYCLLSEVKEV